jgi:predicted enzyme related to lactoylglutathione lyase
MSDYPRGRFVWYDLLTPEPGIARNFYTSVIGWGTDVWEGAGSPYLMWTNGDVPLGGVMRLPDEAAAQGAPPHWLAYITTPDVDAAVALATELGGSVYVDPTDIPTVGRFAILADPQGAVFAVFRPETQPADRDEPAGKGEFSWHELATTDHEAAFDFYHKLFGWKKKEAMDLGEGSVYQMYGRGDFTLGGMYNKPDEMPGPPAWLYYVTVEDVGAAVEKVKELGGEVLNGPMEVPGGGIIAQCLDPQGAAFAIYSDA